MYPKSNIDLSVDFCGVKFEHPFVLAAAPSTDDLEMVRAGLAAGWAGAVLKTTSVEGTSVPLKYPMISGNATALGNIDLISEHHIDKVEDRIRKLKSEFPSKIVIASIMGAGEEDWKTLVGRCGAAGADMIECSFSCPQGTMVDSSDDNPRMGWMLGQDPYLSAKVTTWVKDAALKTGRNLPVVMKLTPHVVDITEIANAVKQAGADAVCLSNTVKSLMGIDLDTWVPHPNINGKSTYSGMSGPAVRPIVLRLVAEVARRVGIKITASGGVTTWADAVEYILCGAGTVQVCTAVMHYGFDIVEDLMEGLSDYLAGKKLGAVSELLGRALPNIVSHDELQYAQKVVADINYNKCILCDICYIACRDGGHMAITVDNDRKPHVDIEKCVGCGLCRVVCPVSGCVGVEPAP